MKRTTKGEFKLPNGTTINGRKSTIAKAFSDGIAPRIQPTAEEYEQFLKFFPKLLGAHTCAYCGGRCDYYEHLRPLVIALTPTGYGSDIYNLVPSCALCNHNKGNNDWKHWMSDTRNRGVSNSVEHNQRFLHLQQFQDWGEGKVLRIDYERLVGSEKWQQYMKEYNRICAVLDEAHALQKEIKSAVTAAVEKAQHPSIVLSKAGQVQ